MGGGTGVLTGCDVGLGGGVLVGGLGLGKGVFVGCGGRVGCGVLVAEAGVRLGTAVSGGWRVGSGPCWVPVAAGAAGVGVEVSLAAGVADETGGLVAVTPGGGDTGVPPEEGSEAVGVGVGDGTSATPSGRSVPGGVFTPSKSWMISRPIAGTERGISSTP